MSFRLLKGSEICMTILSIQDKLQSYLVNARDFIEDASASSSFRIFSETELKAIEKQLETRSITNSLLSRDFHFPFNPTELAKVLELRTDHPHLTYSYVLLSFLSWYLRFSKSDGKEFVELVCHALVVIACGVNFVSIENAELIGTSGLAFITQKSLEMGDFNFDSLVKPLGEYLDNARMIHEAILNLSVRVMHRCLRFQPTIVGNACLFTSVLVKLVQFKRSSIPRTFVTSMLSAYSNAIAHLDPSALQLFHAAADALEENEMAIFFEPMLTYLTMLVDEKGIPDYVRDSEEKVWKVELKFEDTELEPPREPNMLEPFEVIDIQPPYLKMKEIIREKVYVSITLLIGLLLKHKELIERFLIATGELEMPLDSPLLLDQCAILFFIYECAMDFEMMSMPPPENVLRMKIFWNPSITVFDKGENFEYISSFRQVVVNSLPFQPPDFVERFLFDLAIYPLLYAETLLRMHDICSLLVATDEKMRAFTKGIMIPLSEYRNYCDNFAAKKARVAIFMLIRSLLVNSESQQRLLSYREFARYFVLLVLEPPLEMEVFSIISDYLRNVTVSQTGLPIFEVLAKSLTLMSNRCEEIWSKFIKLMSDVVTSNRALAGQVKPLASMLSRNAMTSERIRQSKEFLLALLSILTSTGSSYTIKVGDVFTIEDAIRHKVNELSKDEIMSDLMQIMAGGITPTKVLFRIQQPNTVPSFLRIFLNTEYILEATKAIRNLCTIRANCIQCHHGSVDLYIIEQVKGYCQTGEGDMEVVQEYMSLFVDISTVVSSVQVVRQFISLLCLVNGKYLSRYHSVILQALSAIFAKSKNIPNGYLPLVPGNRIELRGIDAEDVQGGFTFSFWILEDEVIGDCHHNLLTLVDKNNKICFEFSKGTIKIFTDPHNSCEISLGIPVGAWSLVSITLVDVDVEVSVNGKVIGSAKFAKPFHVRNQLTGLVNSKELVSENSCLLLGPVMLFKAQTKSDVSRMFEQGPRKISGDMIPTFSFGITRVNNEFCLRKLHAESKVTLEFPPLHLKHESTFCDLFLDFCKPSMILPIFAQTDCPDINGNVISGLAGLSIAILKSLFELGDRSQFLFFKSSGFRVISFLLLAWNDSNITFGLYSELVDLLRVITHESLELEMFTHVITNIELWMKADKPALSRILRHWIDVLYPERQKTFLKSVTMQWILYVLHQHFQYPEFPVEDHEWLSQCRQSLFDIAVSVSHHTLTSSDIYCIVGYLLREDDWHARVDLLRFLTTAVSNNSTDAASSLPKCVFFMKSLLSNNFDIVIIETIECICNLYHLKIPMVLSFPQQVLRMMRSIQFHRFTEWAFDRLISLLNQDFPELLPLVSMVAVNMGETSIMTLIKSASKGQCYFFGDSSMLWPVVMLFTVSKSHRIEVADFLVSIFATKWECLYYTICMFGRTQSIEDAEDIQSLVLLLMSCRPHLSDETARFLLKVIRRLLFYRDKRSHNRALASAWECSPFNPENGWKPRDIGSPRDPFEDIEFTEEFHTKRLPSYKGRRRKKKGKRRKDEDTALEEPSLSEDEWSHSYVTDDCVVGQTLHDDWSSPTKTLYGHDLLVTQVKQGNSTHPSYSFGLRLGNYGGWIDADLAKAAITLFRKHDLKQFTEMICVILFFLRRTECDYYEKEAKLVAWLKTQVFDENGLLEDKVQRNTIGFFGRFTSFPDMEISSSVSRLLSLTIDTVIDPSFGRNDESVVTEQIDRVIAARTATNFESRQLNGKKWARLWKSLTISRAPWHESIPVKDVTYKRDHCFSFGFCPMRLRQDLRFRDYLRASMLRDTCDAAVTDLALAEIRSRAEEEKPALLLFKVSDIKEQEQDSPRDESGNQKNVGLACLIKTISEEIPAKLIIGKDSLVISARKHAQTIKASEIRHMLYRTRCHRWKGFEIFTVKGTSILLFFEGEKFRTIPMVMRAMPSLPRGVLQLRMFPFFFEELGLTKKWCNGEISNFEYLMSLNIYSGRSFHDLALYPYLPWVIADYESETLDLEDPRVFRDLTKPVGALNEERLKELVLQKSEIDILGCAPFLYSSCPSNPLSVCLYLLRFEPFTSQHISIQGGQFDHAARVFQSIDFTYKSVTGSSGDFRELVPEFFCLPEMFLNNNKLDLGKTSTGIVNDVILPPWAKNAFDFVYKQRKALESEHVSRNLHRWIDLTWGYQQRGPEAWAASNVYREETYDDVWFKPRFKTDAMARKAAEVIQETSGQIPAQLFTKPHPMKRPKPHQNSSSEPFELILNRKVIASQAQGLKWQFIDEHGGMGSATASAAEIRKAIQSGKRKLELLPMSYFGVKRGFNSVADILGEESYVCYEPGASFVNVIQRGVENRRDFPIDVDCLCSSHDGWFVVACSDAVVSIFEGVTPRGSISTFRDSIVCAAIETTQDALVCGTRDQSLLFCSIRHCSVYRAVDLPGKPRHILITRSFGLVLVAMTHPSQVTTVLALYTLNGLLVSETTIDSKVATLSTFVDTSGFDHIILADSSGSIYVFEAYPLSIPRPILQTRSPVISCAVTGSLLSAVSQDGTISIISL